MNHIKHTLAILMAFLIVLTAMPLCMFADESEGESSESAADIRTAEDTAEQETQSGEYIETGSELPVTEDPDDPDQPGSDEMDDPDSYEPNPSPPEGSGLVTITGIRQVGGRGTHIASFSDGYGEGICCFHNRQYAAVGQKGWMRRIETGEAHYSEIRKVMYWGVYMKNGELTLADSFSIHIMLSYWRNGNNSLSSDIKEGTNRFKRAKSYCSTLTAKAEPPESFQIYEWVGTGDASKRQILITYNNGCYVYLEKHAEETNIDYIKEAPNNYSLKGAAYELYTDEGCTNRAKDVKGDDFQLTTDENGISAKAAVEPGNYWAKEVVASRGFRFDDRPIPVTVTTSNTLDHPAKIVSVEPPAKSGLIELRKEDRSGKNGWRRLLGAEYTLKYYDVDPDITDVSGIEPKRTWTFETRMKTDENGKQYAGISFSEDEKISGDEYYVDDGARVLPCGVFTIEETKAPAGLSQNTAVYYGSVYQYANGAEAKTASNTTSEESMDIVIGSESDVENKETPQGIRIVINKKDASGEAKDISLAGAEYEVYYDGDEISVPELVGVIKTDENGYGELLKRESGRSALIGEKLDPGSYIIKEVKPAPGFVIDKYEYVNGETKEVKSGSIDIVCDYEKDGNTVKKIISGMYKDGSHLFRARAEETGTLEFTFTINSADEPTRTYIKKTDIVTTKEVPGAKLQIISCDGENKGTVIEEWTSTCEEHIIYALPAGNYILREITAPYGYDVAEDVNFEIKENIIEHRVEMKNRPLGISTNASSLKSGTHHGELSGDEIVTDTVKISGLYEGRSYKVMAFLVDKSTGQKLKDAEGNYLYDEKSFDATGQTAEAELSFKLDASMLSRDFAAVGFERLYRTSEVSSEDAQNSHTEELPVELAKHEDLSNESQTVHYGGIVSTMALDKKGHSKDINTGKSAVIKDFVEYKNLSPEETYRLDAELYDKTEGCLTGIKAVKNFKPEKPDGTVIVEFRFDARGYEGHELVAYETLSLNNRNIDRHADPLDSNQTVYVSSKGYPDTGDTSGILFYGITGMMSVIVLIVISMRRIRIKE